MANIRIVQWRQVVPAGRGSILDAALKADVPFPHSCRAGECGQCKCRLVEGEVEHDSYAPQALSEEERENGLILACRARPRGDVELAWLAATLPVLPVRRCRGKVVAVEAATHDIVRLRVRVHGETLTHYPGQFVLLSFAGKPARAYSMASLPGASELEFHVRHVPGGKVSSHVAQVLQTGDTVRIEGPFGKAHLQPGETKGVVLVAGGSGLAPVLSILRALLAREADTNIHLYHGVRDEHDLYESGWLQTLASAGRIVYRPVLSHPAGPTAHANGLVHLAMEQDFSTLADMEIYACGPPPMVEAVQSLARQRGVGDGRVHADAFHAAPPQARGLFGRLLGAFGRHA